VRWPSGWWQPHSERVARQINRRPAAHHQEMDMSIQELREQRGVIARQLQDLVAKKDWDAAADQPVYDKAMGDIDAIDANIKRITDANASIAAETRTENMADAADKHARDKNDPGLAVYAKWLRGGDRALKDEDWAVVRNTMSTTTPAEGGFTVQTEVAKSVIDALKAYGGMRRVSNVIAMAMGNPMSWPTSDGTTEEGEIIAENASATDLDVAFGTVGLPVYKFSSKVVSVPIELLQDSNVDIGAFVEGRLTTRLGRITNRLFTTGTGVSQPNGALVAATNGFTAANATGQVSTITYDSLVELEHSVDPAYRERGVTKFMMNDNSLKKVRQIKDTNGRPIFVPGYETGNPGGAPDRLMGHEIVINQNMPNMAASVKSILFGDFQGYVIRDVMDVQMFRFTDSAYTKRGQVGFLAWMRTGGNLTDVGCLRAFTNAAT
jgi:HK97 family phage major capsid protein